MSNDLNIILLIFLLYFVMCTLLCKRKRIDECASSVREPSGKMYLRKKTVTEVTVVATHLYHLLKDYSMEHAMRQLIYHMHNILLCNDVKVFCFNLSWCSSWMY